MASKGNNMRITANITDLETQLDELPADAYRVLARVLEHLAESGEFQRAFLHTNQGEYESTADDVGGALDHVINYCMEVE